jgi:hypothetical protein
MAVTARKLPAADDRAELAAAIKAADAAAARLKRHRDAVERARTAVRDGEKAVERARKGVTEAQEQHGLALAEAAGADDDALPPTNMSRLARAGLQDAEDELAALQSAYRKLLGDPAGCERQLAEAGAEVERCVSAILSPVAIGIIEQLNLLIRRAMPLRRALDECSPHTTPSAPMPESRSRTRSLALGRSSRLSPSAPTSPRRRK